MDLGFAIRYVRIERGMGQYELAKRCGLSQTSLSQIECNKKRPRENTLRKISSALQTPLLVFYIIAVRRSSVPNKYNFDQNILTHEMHRLITQLIGTDHDKMIDAAVIA
jgi:transcriptional regulator with XRE-family HTH domain